MHTLVFMTYLYLKVLCCIFLGEVSANFDSVFWLGDLNFRIDKGRSTVEDVVNAIVGQDHPNFEDLLRTDELLNCLLHGKILYEISDYGD